MRLLVDQCVTGLVIRQLRNAGYDVITLKDLGQESVPDDKVLEIARRLDAVLITADLGFGNILKYPPLSHEGIIVLRLEYRTACGVSRTLLDCLARLGREDLRHVLVTVGPSSYRIRRSGISEP